MLETQQLVSRTLQNQAYRAELEGILQNQLKEPGPRKAKTLPQKLQTLQENVVPAAAVEAAHRHHASLATGSMATTVTPINDLRGTRASRYTLAERQLRCKLASLCRLVDWFGWSQLTHNHVSVSAACTSIIIAHTYTHFNLRS